MSRATSEYWGWSETYGSHRAACDAERGGELPAGVVARADVPDLPLADEVVERRAVSSNGVSRSQQWIWYRSIQSVCNRRSDASTCSG